MKKNHRYHLLNLGIILVAFLFFYPKFDDPKLFMGGDNAAYYILSKGIADGHGYVNYNIPAMPAANHFPPGYPFILSAFLFVTNGSMSLTDHVSGLFFLLCLFLCYLFAVRITGQRLFATIATLFILLNRYLLEYATITMSEITFAFFLLLTIYLFMRVIDRSQDWKSPWFYALIACAILTIYIRTQGIVVVGSAGLFLVLKKRYLDAAFLVGFCLIALAPWQIRSSNLGGNTYVKQLLSVNPYDAKLGPMKAKDWPGRFTRNATRYFSKEIPNALFPGIKVTYNTDKGIPIPAPASHWAFGIFLMGLTAAGVWAFKPYRWFFLPFFCGTFLILFLWPDVWFGVRFLLPVVPLIILFALTGMWFLVRLIFRKLPETAFDGKWAFVVLPLCLVHVQPLKELHLLTTVDYAPNWKNYFRMAEWTAAKLPANVTICTRKPELFYVQSGKKSVGFMGTADEDVFLRQLIESKVTHVVVEQLGFRQTSLFLVPFMVNNPEKFELVYSYGAYDKNTTSGVWLYQFHPKLGYQGGYKNGKKEGKGYVTSSKGVRIDGTWKNNQLNGPGVMHTPEGMVYEGRWEKGLKNGPFTISNTKKAVRVLSEWKNDTMLREGWLLDRSNNKLKKIPLF